MPRKLARPPAGVLAAAVVTALIAAGCGSNSAHSGGASGSSVATGSSSGSSVATGSSSGPAASSSLPGGIKVASVAALVPATIRQRGELTVAVDPTYEPDESVAKDGHTIVGMDPDLAKALAATMGLRANLVKATFSTIIPGLASGKYDVGLSSFGDTRAREKIVDFVTYFQAGEGFYTKGTGGVTVTGLGSLCGKSVAVENGTTEQADGQKQSKTCKSRGKSAVNVLAFTDQNGANLAVSSGRAQLGFADSQVVDYIVKQSNGQFAVVGPTIEVVPYGIALPKGNGMAKPMQAAMTALIKDGTYQQILTKWGVQKGAITKSVIDGATS